MAVVSPFWFGSGSNLIHVWASYTSVLRYVQNFSPNFNWAYLYFVLATWDRGIAVWERSWNSWRWVWGHYREGNISYGRNLAIQVTILNIKLLAFFKIVFDKALQRISFFVWMDVRNANKFRSNIRSSTHFLKIQNDPFPLLTMAFCSLGNVWQSMRKDLQFLHFL